MKRATLPLENGIYDQLKALSQQWATTFKQVVNDVLRVGILSLRRQAPKKRAKLKLPFHSNNGLRPGVDISDRNSLYDLIEDEQ